MNITDLVDDDIRQMPAITEPIAIGEKLPHLRGCYFFCKGTGKRMRDLARRPMDNGSIIRILDDCEHYEIIADNPVMPTSELPSHLLVHDKQVETGSGYKATLHTHPIELVAMSHHRPFLKKDVLTRHELPGSVKLAEGTLNALADYDVVLWEKHGVFAKGTDIMDAFDQVDVLSKSAKIYIDSRAMGYEPEGMSDEQMKEMTRAFHLPK